MTDQPQIPGAAIPGSPEQVYGALLQALLPTLTEVPTNFMTIPINGPQGPRVLLVFADASGVKTVITSPENAKGMGQQIVDVATAAGTGLMLPGSAAGQSGLVVPR